MRRPWAAIIGHPVRHSLSPRIFRWLGQRQGRALNYRAADVEPSALAEAVASARAKPWLGWNVTMPHKVAILDHLNDLDASAREAGAVNVVRFLDGRCIGYNTDGEGFLSPLSRGGFSLQGKRAVLLGAGGAAKAVEAALRRSGIGEVVGVSRKAGNWSPGAIREAVAAADLVVQATPLGMDGTSSPLDGGESWKAGALAYDLVYRPGETPFLRQARAKGAATLSGLSMLAAQAAATWRIWFDETIPERALGELEEDLKRIL